MDTGLEKFIKDWNSKYKLKMIIEKLDFNQQNDIYYTKLIDEKNIHVKFDESEFSMWCSNGINNKKYIKYYNTLRSEVDRGFYTEEVYINDTINLLIKGVN